MVKKIKLTWTDIDKACVKMAKAVAKHRGLIKNVYGVPRGGLIIAVRMSHLLDVPLLLDKDRIKWNTLVVDDILDKGDTLQRLLRGKRYFGVGAVVLNSDTKKDILDLPAPHTKRSTDWVYFPWETNKSSKYDKTI